LRKIPLNLFRTAEIYKLTFSSFNWLNLSHVGPEDGFCSRLLQNKVQDELEALLGGLASSKHQVARHLQ
jgi:hypothetical protein